MEIINASKQHVPIIQQLANDIWPKVYASIISVQQIEYMLDMMYNKQTLEQQIQEGYQYFILFDDNLPQGFSSTSATANKHIFKLHKLYVQPQHHKKGFGKALLQQVEQYCLLNQATHLQLQVNKKNPAVEFYFKIGFTLHNSLVFDIGNGFVMDDYILQKALA